MRDIKLTYALYLLIGTPGSFIVVCAIIIAKPSYGFQLFLALLALMFFLIILILVLQLLSQKHLNKIRDLLYENCDPEKYIQNCCEKMCKNTILTKLDLSLGYIYLGDYDTALLIIGSITLKTALERKTYAFYYYNCFLICFLRKGDIGNAQQTLEIMKSFLPKNITPSQNTRHAYRYYYLLKHYDLNIAQGNYDGALQFLYTLPPAESMLERVSYSYTFAQVYAGLGKPAAAREAANFVIANGNKTVYVSLAQKLLAEIGQ